MEDFTRVRFSLARLAGSIALAAVGLSVAKFFSEISVRLCVSAVVLWSGVLIAFITRRGKWPFWLGFQLAGWGYLGLAMAYLPAYYGALEALFIGVGVEPYDELQLPLHILAMTLAGLGGGVLFRAAKLDSAVARANPKRRVRIVVSAGLIFVTALVCLLVARQAIIRWHEWHALESWRKP